MSRYQQRETEDETKDRFADLKNDEIVKTAITNMYGANNPYEYDPISLALSQNVDNRTSSENVAGLASVDNLAKFMMTSRGQLPYSRYTQLNIMPNEEESYYYPYTGQFWSDEEMRRFGINH